MRVITLLFICVLACAACSLSVEQEKLVGRWDYLKIENLNPSSDDSTTAADLKQAKPYIYFSADHKLQIYWDGKLLSSGDYKLDGKMIRYTEKLPDGGKREFPFLVSSLSDSQLVFQTMSREGTSVTAVKRK